MSHQCYIIYASFFFRQMPFHTPNPLSINANHDFTASSCYVRFVLCPVHILNQKKPYDESYDNISRADYVSGNWTSVPEKRAYALGFVSPYSMENPAEDIAELYSIYVTSTPDEWNTILKAAGTKGTSIINRKLKMVRDYMKNSWNADIDLLRNAILRRGGKISTLDLNSLN